MTDAETPTLIGKLTQSENGQSWKGKCPVCRWPIMHGLPEGSSLPAHRLAHCKCEYADGYFIDIAE